MLGAILGGIGSVVGSLFNKSAADKQADLQKDFAQKGIQWKVADAVKAGLHPLAALGANTVSYSPVQVGDMAGPLSDMGQNVGRAITATQNGTERMTGQLGVLATERAGLENDLLRTQIASQQAQLRAQVGPPMPTDGGAGQTVAGQGDSFKMHGGEFHFDPTMTKAQDWSDRFGEIAEEIVGANNLSIEAEKNLIAYLKANLGRRMGFRDSPGMIAPGVTQKRNWQSPRAARGAYRY